MTSFPAFTAIMSVHGIHVHTHNIAPPLVAPPCFDGAFDARVFAFQNQQATMMNAAEEQAGWMSSWLHDLELQAQLPMGGLDSPSDRSDMDTEDRSSFVLQEESPTAYAMMPMAPSPPSTPARSIMSQPRPAPLDEIDANDSERPEHSYARLAAMAIDASPSKRATVGEIYAWIEANYPFYRNGAPWWKNCIRHNLSMKKTFSRVQIEDRNYWAICPEHYDDILRSPRGDDRRSGTKRRRRSSMDSMPESPKSKTPRSPKMRPSSARRGISKAEASPAVVPAPPMSFLVPVTEHVLEEVWLPAMDMDQATHIAAQPGANDYAISVVPPMEGDYLDALGSWEWDMSLDDQSQ